MIEDTQGGEDKEYPELPTGEPKNRERDIGFSLSGTYIGQRYLRSTKETLLLVVRKEIVSSISE